MRAVDAAAVRAWATACVTALDALRADIDRINVYPVPDSDTGSNLLHTVTGARDALAQQEPDNPDDGAGTALAAFARGAVRAARGNSGVILSQLLRGVADSAGDAVVVDAPGLAAALARAERTAIAAVARPVDGTMLSVLTAAARGAENARRGGAAGVPDVAGAAADAAAAALAETPQQLAVLADAGVVDAGGRGVLAVLDELAAVIADRPAKKRPEFAGAGSPGGPVTPQGKLTESSQPWEVMYLLDGMSDLALPELRDRLSALGDCVTIAGDGAGSHAVHVHCADIGAALEAGLNVGRPRDVRVESLAVAGGSLGGRAVLAVVHGRDLGELCRQEGVTALACDTRNPLSIDRVMHAVTELRASHVVVLPAGAETTSVVEAATERAVTAGKDVVVIPCASPVQVLAAIAVHDVERRAADDVVAMAEAAAATRRGELLVAAEDAMTWVGTVRAGDLVGFVDGEVVLIEPGVSDPSATVVADAAMSVVERMLSAGGELVTLLLGARAPDGIDAAVAERLARAHPEVEFAAYQGGQTESMLTFGVE
ncbi:MAG: DAK2 domain-containing protein [Actinophytocola sp.]|nr:DAK2 domain-containing protein [Actinophytocola sp.]